LWTAGGTCWGKDGYQTPDARHRMMEDV